MTITSPDKLSSYPISSYKIFLAGTIDSGNSEDWQSKICDMFDKTQDIIIFNPRRDIWPEDSDKSEVEKQIRWEHHYLDLADLIIMNILPDSKSPISLMEIGIYANSGKLVIFCPVEFYRFDNVRLVCEKYKIPLINSNRIEDICDVISDYILFLNRKRT